MGCYLFAVPAKTKFHLFLRFLILIHFLLRKYVFIFAQQKAQHLLPMKAITPPIKGHAIILRESHPFGSDAVICKIAK
jgi:hypothetical protein